MLNNTNAKGMRRGSLPLRRLIFLRAFQKPLRWRLKHQYFQLPVELWLLRAGKHLVMRRSLLTGQSLSRSIEIS